MISREQAREILFEMTETKYVHAKPAKKPMDTGIAGFRKRSAEELNVIAPYDKKYIYCQTSKYQVVKAKLFIGES